MGAAAAEPSHASYRIPTSVLKSLNEAGQILQGLQLTDGKRAVYYPEYQILTIQAREDVHLLVQARIDEANAAPTVAQAEARALKEKLDAAFNKMNPDKIRDYLRQVDKLIQEGRHAEAKRLLKLCEDTIQRELINPDSKDHERWLALLTEAEERRIVLALKSRQGAAITSTQPDSAFNKMPIVQPPPLLDHWQDKSKPFEFNGETYYNMPLPPRR